ncbi:putative inactive disease susceptibility protein LOV1 [Salvia hispanica]|uniref:putative inactive disease susceptibility protein LOV1 n=1 Tax=Salvia hispanica TaxID=49212 RepID=UPI002009471A|nr:putative inactive disease susceptibility protein LOV1 [Salvia hispanica]
MSAYGAVISLKNTIQFIVESPRLFVIPTGRILRPAYEAVCDLQTVLKKLEKTGYIKIRTKVNALDEQIKEAVWDFEDLLESHIYDQILPQVETDHLSFYGDLQSHRKSAEVTKMEEEDNEDEEEYKDAEEEDNDNDEEDEDDEEYKEAGEEFKEEEREEDNDNDEEYMEAEEEYKEGREEDKDNDDAEYKEAEEEEEEEYREDKELYNKLLYMRQFIHQNLPSLRPKDRLAFLVDLHSLKQSIDRFVIRVTAMAVEYDVALLNMPEEEGEPISSRIEFGGIGSYMVGLTEEFEQVRDYFLAEKEENCFAITGMAGIGKTTLAKKIFDDPLIQGHFELRAWVKVGRKCEPNDVIRGVLAQVDPNTQDQMLTQGDDDDDLKLDGVLEDILKDKKCLIVLDDVWEWDTQLMGILPDKNVRIMLTSRLRMEESPSQVVRLLNEEESKKLLCEKVFGEEGFPLSLEKKGEKIAEKCEGLPLMIVIVAELLSEEDKTPEYWTEVAEKQHNSVFVDAYNQISEVFFPSYDYLPQYFKMLFLYMGSSPPYCDINIADLFRRLGAEGFLESIGNETLEEFIGIGLKILSQLYNLVIIHESNVESWFSKREFRVHSCWQHVCKKEASKIKFLHVLQSCDDDMKGQRRLCAHHNTLFAFKQVYDSIKSTCASTARSILCLGPYHQYPVPIHDMDFKLLRVFDALEVRFYHIPLDIMKLVCLNYLALTCNGEIPISISNLFHLQTLTIHPHINIKKRGAPLYVPMVIWDMQELQHISISGRDLPTPKSDATLEKLSSLFGVSAKSCIRENLKRIPNLRMLEIMMELKPYDDDDDINPLSGLEYISKELHKLVLLSYILTNPDMRYQSIVPLLMFPSSLAVLALSGLGCPWKHMNDIGSLLPNLRNLRLLHYAFHGPEWNIESGYFLKLETLVIEDTDLVRLRPQRGSLPMLELLSIRHCYKLRQVDWTCDPSKVTKPTIELVECSPSVVAFSEQLRPHLNVHCYSSF